MKLVGTSIDIQIVYIMIDILDNCRHTVSGWCFGTCFIFPFSWEYYRMG